MSDPVLHLTAFTAGAALLAVALIFPPGIALAWLLARKEWPGKSLVETCVALPLALPPVVTGLLLLVLLGRRGPIGGWLHAHGIDLVFAWPAVVLALAVMALPLFVRTVRAAIEEVDPALEQTARTLGAGEARVFRTVTLPLSRRGIVAGTLLAFARALGEFGATVMVAGIIPGKTMTLSTAIYQDVLEGRDDEAWLLVAIVAAMAFAALWFGERLQKRKGRA
ncbi:molybdate transport system permease protein [Verrucomicrobium sp. GAS474]|uniref:molybdate ABC transporter permease subunit n=1 Tax=Verrucomicrobium sp. GAS474 TaxID=1882831 RepID=UPI00087A7CFB|nr:molybdate ABC transporter permease subunit [Verrucomicrobium sp. GAS474]SDU23716.1 molybdate transport system permease protein [Verrucomicrobium sp. GAS474]